MNAEREEYEELVLNLPKVTTWTGSTLYQYQGLWCGRKFWPSILSFQKHFQALDSDIIVATLPKSGTTWLKALAYSVINRSPSMNTNSPLLSTNPHKLVPFLDVDIYHHNPSPLLDHLPSPRLLGAHVPCNLLPSSIHNSKCRIIYLCRNPLDQFISHYMFNKKINALQESGAGTSLVRAGWEEAFDMFCRGHQSFGPHWDHALEYWKMSLERPDKVFFFKYEDLKEDTAGWVRKMGEFFGCPFSEEEEKQGMIEGIIKLCSFETMKDLEVNKSGEYNFGVRNEYLFRKGKVGDWAHHLTPEMVERAKKIVEDKLQGSGLIFDFNQV